MGRAARNLFAKIKILHVLESFSPKFGAPVTILKSLARAQAKRGCDVTVCVTNLDHPEGIFHEAGEERHCGGKMKIMYFPVQMKSTKISMQMSRFLIRNVKIFDVVHVHGIYLYLQVFAAAVARKFDKPYLVSPHGSLDHYLYKKVLTTCC